MQKEKDFAEAFFDSKSEENLLRECRQGKLSSFEPIVQQYQSYLGQLSYQILRDQALAEDCTQLTFVKAWQKLHRFNGKCALKTWLYRICINTASDMIRSQKRKKEDFFSKFSEDQEKNFYLKDESLGLDQKLGLKDWVWKALEQLPAAHRQVLILREMQGLDYHEISEVMNCRKGTTMSRLFHARKKMRQLLEKII